MTFGDPALSPDDQAHLATFVSNSSYTGIAMLSTADGSLQWQRRVESAMQDYSGWLSFGEGADSSSLYAGTSRGVLCLDRGTGLTLWEYVVPSSITNATQQGVPAHPTYEAGRVFFTFESGVTSSPLIVVNASSGQLLWYTEELVVTLIWRVRAVDGVAYCGWNVAANNIFCTVRLYDGQKLWSKDNLTFSDPGLWDNPNLVVDAAGAHTFMYTKPHEGLRCVTGFDSKTGQQLWYLPQTGDVDDYDTFAWNGQYFRLMTVPDTNDTSMVVQMRDGATGDSKWSTTFNSNSDCIVLVGGDTLNSNGFVVVFGLTENQLFGFDALTGSPLWVFSDINSPTTGILDRSGWLYFGDGTGTYRSIAANLTLTSSDLQQAHMTTLVKVAIILGVSFGTIFAVSGVLWLIQHCNVPEETAAADIQNTQQYASTIAYKQL